MCAIEREIQASRVLRILLGTHAFFPSVGGIEIMSHLLAHELTRRGHEVMVLTETPHDFADTFPFKVVRNPSAQALLDAVRWCDVFFQNNISLRTLWPLLFFSRPWVVRHATWIRRNDGGLGWQDQLKRFLLRFSTGISNSCAVANDLPVPTTVIGNPYRDDQFKVLPHVPRDRDLVFLGRLVSDKGVMLLLQAVRDLKSEGLNPTLTFIGSGPELETLSRLAMSWGIADQIDFAGPKTGNELVERLNQHRIMVVPSLWNEPFGIVALEGAACGCALVGSAGGGLKDAIGPCGVTFPNGDVDKLCAVLRELLTSQATIRQLTDAAGEHLARHTVRHVVDRYMEVIDSAVIKRKVSGRRGAA